MFIPSKDAFGLGHFPSSEFIQPYFFVIQEDGIQPFVSITPIAGGGDSDHKIQNKSDNAGIEIIPLGDFFLKGLLFLEEHLTFEVLILVK